MRDRRRGTVLSWHGRSLAPTRAPRTLTLLLHKRNRPQSLPVRVSQCPHYTGWSTVESQGSLGVPGGPGGPQMAGKTSGVLGPEVYDCVNEEEKVFHNVQVIRFTSRI